jgi:hypothetical protein
MKFYFYIPKTILLILILILSFSTHLKAQDDYIPLAVENAQWIVATGDMTSVFLVEYLWEYLAKGDTIINGYVYKKIYYRGLVTTQDPPPFIPKTDFQLKGFIRDDTLERKVFAIDLYAPGGEFCPANEEFLMYDFSVNQGDTIDFCLLPDWETVIVDTIHSDVYQGFDTRRYQLLWSLDSYFEGIGSDYGLFEAFFIPVDKRASNPLYYNFLYYYCRQAPCGLIVSLTEQENPASFLQLYPNPATNILNVRFNNLESEGEIRIFSIHGQELRRILLDGKQLEYQLYIPGLKAGIYFLVFYSNRSVLFKEKFSVLK